MTGQYRINTSPLLWHYLFATLASLALSVWSIWLGTVPNPDAALYLRAADYFAAGRFHDGLAVYKWPTYSIVIGITQLATGLEAVVAAQVVNALFTLVTTIAFIALAAEFTRRDRLVVTIATLFIAFQPQLLQLRSWIIRDHGYIALFMVTVYLAVADNERPSPWRKLALGMALLGATLFRVEGLYLALLVLGYYALKRLRTATAQVLTIIALIFGATLLLPFAFSIWVNGTFSRWLEGQAATVDLSLFTDVIRHRVEVLGSDVLEGGGGRKWSAYVSIIVGITIMDTIRAITPVFAFLGVIAFVPNLVVPRKAVLPIAWFTIAQFPMLFLVGFINALMDWRYPMALALIAMFGIVFTATLSWREFLMFRPRSLFGFPVLVIACVATFAADVPKSIESHHFVDAGHWMKQNIPPASRIWMNDGRIAYFSGRSYRETGGVTRLIGLPPTSFEKEGAFDVIVVWSGANLKNAPIPVDLKKLSPVATFENGSEKITIYAKCTQMVRCPI